MLILVCKFWGMNNVSPNQYWTFVSEIFFKNMSKFNKVNIQHIRNATRNKFFDINRIRSKYILI